MGRPIRYLPSEGSGLVEVTCRTLQGRYLLTPSPELNEILLGALGRAQQLYRVGIIAFAFASNHFHLLLRVESTRQLALFMGHFNSNLAREAGRLVRWREKFWGRRYQAIPISEEEAAQVARLRYVLAHGCKEGLAERLRDWPGVSTVRALLEEEPLEGYWFDRTREHRARRQGKTFEHLEFPPPTRCISSHSPAGCISRPRSTGGGLPSWLMRSRGRLPSSANSSIRRLEERRRFGSRSRMQHRRG